MSVYSAADTALIKPLVAELIRARQKKLGWTQTRLGAAIGMSFSSVSAWENLRGLPSWDVFIECIEVLGLRMVLVDRVGTRHRLGTRAGVSVLKELAALLRAERERRGLAQLKLAAKLGVTVCTLSRWERGATGTRVRITLQWVNSLECMLELEPVKAP